MLNICLCDDDIYVLNYYSNRIKKIADENNYMFKIETFESGESVIFELEDNPNRFNIIIIDIIMKNINGIEATKILRKYGYTGVIIFLTSSKEYALDSFSVEPLNYILKNDDNNRFNDTFMKAVREVDKMSNRNIIVSTKAKNLVINLDSILYMESLSKKVIIHKLSGDFEEVNCVFKNVYDRVKEYGFVRCHKSYILNMKYIQTFNKLECTLQNDVLIPIGRKYSKDFKLSILENEFNNILI